MILWTFAIITGILLMAAITIIFASFVVSFSCRFTESVRCLRLSFHWLHPFVLEGMYDLSSQTWWVRLLKRYQLFPRSSREEPEEPGDSSAPKDPSGKEEPSDKETEPVERVTPKPPPPPLHKTPPPEEPPSPLSEPKNDREDSETGGDGLEEGSTAGAGEEAEPPEMLSGEEKNKKRQEGTSTSQEKTNTKKGPFAGIKEKIDSIKKNKNFFILRQTKLRNKVLRWVYRLLNNLLRIIFFEKLCLRIKVSLSDPSLAGKLYGYTTGLRHALTTPGPDRILLAYEPIFDREHEELLGDIRFKTSLSRLLRPVVSALLTFPYINAFIVWRRTKAFVKAQSSENKVSP
ncbi:MAG: hypothetical protein GF401_09900 [Chitinivibrionales bacterium]|nr:hypothetical protein [Chitinivibrionales bacterium]